MKLNGLITKLSMLIAMTVSPYLASAGPASNAIGGSNGGGGSDMESEFKTIATNIADWIRAGRSSGLKLRFGVTQEQYRTGMLRELTGYSIQMVSRPLFFGGSEKTCVSRALMPKTETNPIRNLIECNQALFRDTYRSNPEGAYRLVHHEFAGLAGLEKNIGQNSDYHISDQISPFLEKETVLRLPVNDLMPDPVGLRTFLCGNNLLLQTHKGIRNEDEPYGNFLSQVSPRDYVLWLMTNKNSFLTKALQAKGLFPDGESELSDSIGLETAVEGGGRVSNYSVIYLIPIHDSGKRWSGISAYIRVTLGFDWDRSIPAYTPDAREVWSLRVDGIFSPYSAQDSIDFAFKYRPPNELTSKICRDVAIPRYKAPTLGF